MEGVQSTEVGRLPPYLLCCPHWACTGPSLGLASRSSPPQEWGSASPPNLGCKWVEKLNSHRGTCVGHTTYTRPRTSTYTHLLMRVGGGRDWAGPCLGGKGPEKEFFCEGTGNGTK